MAMKKYVLIPGTGSHFEPSRGKSYKAEIDGPPVLVASEEDLVAKFPGKFRPYRSKEDLKPIGDIEDTSVEHDPRTMKKKPKKDPHSLNDLQDENDPQASNDFDDDDLDDDDDGDEKKTVTIEEAEEAAEVEKEPPPVKSKFSMRGSKKGK